MRHEIIFRLQHTYASHPCVTKLASGDWLVAFCASTQRRPYLHPPFDPQFINVICRSCDQGETWQRPRVAPNYEWSGVETPGIAQISSGDVLLNQFRFLWYPLETARKRWLEDGERAFIFDVKQLRWRVAAAESDWERHLFPYARADGGAFVHISRDDGRTWDETVPVGIDPYQGAFSPKGAIELTNGPVVLALGSHDHDPLHASFIVRSDDGGHSWQKPIEAARVPERIFSEPSVTQTASGKLVLLSRDEATGFLYQSESTDAGETWSTAHELALWGYPAHIVTLGDGRLVAVYGRRKPPHGIRASLSEDEGRTWGPEVVIRDDFPNDNLGYPSVIEYAPGRLFTAYYGEDRDGVTCIQGTFFDI